MTSGVRRKLDGTYSAETVKSGSILKIQRLFLKRSPAALMLSALLFFGFFFGLFESISDLLSMCPLIVALTKSAARLSETFIDERKAA